MIDANHMLIIYLKFHVQLQFSTVLCCYLVTKFCLTLETPSAVTHQAPFLGISQARILEWVVMSPALAGGFFITEPPGKPIHSGKFMLIPSS